jgi:hypothetical protein
MPDSSSVSYIYSPTGQKLAVNNNGSLRYFLFDYKDVIGEFDENGYTIAKYNPGISINMEGMTGFYHNDGIGSTTKMTNSSGITVAGADFDRFGLLNSEQGFWLNDRLLFKGMQRENTTGIYSADYGIFYDPGTGKYIRSQPLCQLSTKRRGFCSAESGNELLPNSNLFDYGNNNFQVSDRAYYSYRSLPPPCPTAHCFQNGNTLRIPMGQDGSISLENATVNGVSGESVNGTRITLTEFSNGGSRPMTQQINMTEDFVSALQNQRQDQLVSETYTSSRQRTVNNRTVSETNEFQSFCIDCMRDHTGQFNLYIQLRIATYDSNGNVNGEKAISVSVGGDCRIRYYSISSGNHLTEWDSRGYYYRE